MADLRPIDLFDDLDDDAARGVGRGHAAARVAPGEIIAEQDGARPGLLLLLEGTARRCSSPASTSSRSAASSAPTWMGAIAALTEGPLACACTPRRPAASAMIGPADFRELALAQPAVHRRVMQQVAPVMSRVTAIEQNRERLASLGHDGRRASRTS